MKPKYRIESINSIKINDKEYVFDTPLKVSHELTELYKNFQNDSNKKEVPNDQN